jgi:uncharacterized protein YodC (DUF2158 family)
MTFQTGDVVQLKAGGPKMTVEGGLTERSIACVWFDGAQLQRGMFGHDVLRKVSV